MRKFKIFKILFIIMCITACNILENKTLMIPKGIIQKKVEKKFPISKNLIIAKMVLTNPKVTFEGEKIYIEAEYDINTIERKNKGKLYLSSNVKYNNEKEELYLVGFSIDKIVDENNEEKFNSKNDEIIKNILSNYLEMTPVYKLKEDEERKNIKIKNIFIKDGNFYIET